MRIRQRGADFETSPIAGGGFLGPTQAAQHVPIVDVRFPELRLEGNGTAIAEDGFVQATEIPQRVAEVAVGFGEVRPATQGAMVANDCLLHLPQLAQQGAQVVQDLGVVGVERECAAQRCHRILAATLVIEAQRERVPQIGARRRRRERCGIGRGGLHQPAGGVQPGRPFRVSSGNGRPGRGAGGLAPHGTAA